MQGQAIAQQLKNLKDEASALWFMNYKLAEQIGEVIEVIGAPADGPAQREVALRYLAAASNAEARRVLIEARGERSAAVLRTKLNTDLEQLAGRRHLTNGRAKANGHSAPLDLDLG